MFALIVAVLWPGVDVRASTDELSVSAYVYVGQSRVGRTHYDYTYRISVTNAGGPLSNIVATAASNSSLVEIIEPEIVVGEIGSLATVTASDSFIFRLDRRATFDPASIDWTFNADASEPDNTPPVADAGPDQTVASGDAVALDGTGSTDADGDPITYRWTLPVVPAGSSAVLDDASSPLPGFIADVPGDYIGELVVSDGQADSVPDAVVISTSNTPPVADAGLDIAVPVGGTAVLFGGASSDANGDPLTYRWSLVERPDGSTAMLADPNGIETRFAVDVAGTYAVELIVNDGYEDSAPDRATVTTLNTPPVADAGLDQEVETGETVTLDGSFSFDVDDDPLSYSWSLISTPEDSIAVIEDVDFATTGFVPDVSGNYVAQLIVNDGNIDSEPDTSLIVVAAGNHAPVAAAAADAASVAPGDTVRLDGTGSADPDDDPLTYRWSLSVPAGSAAALSSISDASPSFTADVEGSYLATLIVNDGELDSEPSSVSISATEENHPPELATVGDRVVHVGDTLAFRLFGIDPDVGDVLTYSMPVSIANLAVNPGSGDVAFTPAANQAGVHTLLARVEDAGGLWATRSFAIEVRQALTQPGVGHPPALAPIEDVSIQVGSPLSIQATATDADPGDALTWSLPLAPAGMSIDGNGLIAFVATAGQAGRHDVTVQVGDASGAVAVQNFIVTVIADNRAPVAQDDVYSVNAGAVLEQAAPGVLANDGDAGGDPLTASLLTTTTKGTLNFNPDGSFDYTLTPPDSIVDLQVECEVPLRPSGFQTNGTVAVGDVDNDGEAEIVGFNNLSGTNRPELWVLNGATCEPELARSPDVVAAGGFSNGSHAGLLDIDGDGDLEIIGPRNNFPPEEGGSTDWRHLLAVHHDGTIAWPRHGGSESSGLMTNNQPYRYAGPTFADIDGNGTAEIIMTWTVTPSSSVTRSGLTVYNSADGSILWEYLGSDQRPGASYIAPVVADLDLDGTMEIIVHTDVVDHEGALEFRLPAASFHDSPIPQLYTAVANFDGDPQAEIVAHDNINNYLFNHDGTLIWAVPATSSLISQSQITVADFDGDGEVEFTYKTEGPPLWTAFTEVYDTDGSVLWSHRDNPDLQLDRTSANFGPNATAFDANRDGAADMVVHYNNPSNAGIYIFDGRDGSVLEFLPLRAYFTQQRFITVADVDNDGEAEIVSSYSDGLGGFTRVWGGTPGHPLPPAPPVRNQWIFQYTMINPDGSVPAAPRPPWLVPGLNGYHLVPVALDGGAPETDSFTYAASDGALISNIATATIEIRPPGNSPPQFLSQPDTLTTVGFPYDYLPLAYDPDFGDTLTYELVNGPAGMMADPSSGRVRWTPETVGSVLVSLIVSDGQAATMQSYTLQIGEPVVVPDVVGLEETTAADSLTAANLVTGGRRAATHASVPAGAVLAQVPIAGSVAEFGAAVDLVISLGPLPEDIDHDGDGVSENGGDCNDADASIRPGADDAAGDGVDSDCDGIDGNLVLTGLVVTPATATVLVGQPVHLTATGIFEDGTSQNLTHVVTWTGGPVFSASSAGVFTPEAARGDISAAAQITVVERVGEDAAPPRAEIDSPAANTAVTAPTPVQGTATDPNFLRYELAIAVAGTSNFTVIATGASPVVSGDLGELDPTLLINGQYTLRLTVYDSGGNQAVTEITVLVDGQMKVGNFTVSFNDLHIPMAGIPLTVTRTYDSRDKSQGDFGIGWRLGMQSLRLVANRVQGTGWRVDRNGLSFVLQPNGAHVVSLTLPGGRLEQFEMVVSPRISPLVPFPPSVLQASYVPRPGTRGTLESLDNNLLTVFDPQPGPVELTDDQTGATWNPDRFRYTMPNGTEIVISRSRGVERIREPNGNTLSINAAGIFHSAGSQALIERDHSGRITRLTDPAGNVQTYTYDANGDLRTHTDRNGNVNRYAYNRSHGLISMTGGDGNEVVRHEYDDDGRLIRTIDADGNAVTYEHNLEQRWDAVTDRSGGVTLYEYDLNGNIVRETDPAGNLWQYGYDDQGSRISVTDPAGEVWTSEYNALGLESRSIDPLGHVTEAAYDASGRVTSVTDANGNTTSYEYDARGNRISVTDPNGNVTRATFDAGGNLAATTDANGNTTTFSYDSLGRLTGSTDALGNTTAYTEDTLGNLLETQRTLVNSEGSFPAIWQSGYDANGNPVSERVPRSTVTALATYDANDRLSGGTGRLGNDWNANRTPRGEIGSMNVGAVSVLQASYDESGRATALSADDFGVITRQYDANGNDAAVTLPDTGTLQKAWDGRGLLLKTTDPSGNETVYGYDAAGRRVSVETPGGIAKTIVYDANGKVTAGVYDSGRTFEYRYDDRGRQVGVTGPDGIVRSAAYDPAGNLLSQELPLGESWQYEYDALNQLISSTDADGGRYGFGYDSFGSLGSMTSPSGATTRFVHDALGRMTSLVLPEGQRRAFVYDDASRIVESLKFDGTSIALDYDDTARTLTRLAADGSTVYTFDTRNRTVAFEAAAGRTDVAFDGAGRLRNWSGPDSADVQYDRDPHGLVSRLRTPNGDTLIDYDRVNRTRTTTFDGRSTVYRMDALGIPTEADFAGGIVARHDYDAAGRALRLQYANGAGALLQLDYSYDAAGRIGLIERADGTSVSYTYDALGRLASETRTGDGAATLGYVYDGDNNIARIDSSGGSRTFTYDRNGRLLEAGGVRYGWDANGNLRSRARDGMAEGFEYDSHDRLIAYRRTGTNPVQVEYSYDHDDLLHSRRVNGEVTVYNWDRSNAVLPILAEELDGAGQLKRRYFNDRMFITHSVDAFGSELHYLRDHLGTVVAVVDGSGATVAEASYDAYGNTAANLPALPGFANGLRDTENGLVFMRSRWYSPGMRRFIQMDSAAPDPHRPRTINRYVYVSGDPVNRFDPSGQSEYSLASTIVQMNLSMAFAAMSHIMIQAGPEELVAGGFGLRSILESPHRGPDAKFFPLGVFSAGINATGIGLGGGIERLKFVNGQKKAATYWYFGPELSVPFKSGRSLVGVGASVAIIGKSAVMNTPTPIHHQGYAISASIGGSSTGQILSKLSLGAGAGMSGFWSPVPTYQVSESGKLTEWGERCVSCQTRYGFGYRSGLSLAVGQAGGSSAGFSFAITLKGLINEYDIDDDSFLY